ncbi:uncharacterized protein LOC122499871 [Leptopilina heterotoma]|uniref:uncharacterized protein LOC122499871 n=1 Tax=Leptopilina heterotoma TaxID=63436 RepID=UPI001CA832D2|nr:uncharacterized protein LOC122499871 [Leptopilina heterotoma]
MKFSISIFLMLLSVLINNCQSSDYGDFRQYRSRLEAEEHCISTIFKTKTSLIFRTKKRVVAYACKGNPEIYHKKKIMQRKIVSLNLIMVIITIAHMRKQYFSIRSRSLSILKERKKERNSKKMK